MFYVLLYFECKLDPLGLLNLAAKVIKNMSNIT
jgi:hypothetical protein